MSVEMNVTYTGELRCELAHGPSGVTITTDAPTDNQGKGASFSPTDLLGAALASCALTTMAIQGRARQINFTQGSAKVAKLMTQKGPRRVSELVVDFTLPESLNVAEREALQQIARGCPVALSLSAEVGLIMRFHYA